MCELRHPSISTSRRRSKMIIGNAIWLQVPFIGVDKLLSGFKYGLDKLAVVGIDDTITINRQVNRIDAGPCHA